MIPLIESKLINDEITDCLIKAGFQPIDCYHRIAGPDFNVVLSNGYSIRYYSYEVSDGSMQTETFWDSRRIEFLNAFKSLNYINYSKLPPLEDNIPELGLF